MRLRRTFLTLAATLAASLGAPGALAAPNNANTITLDLACSDGLYYSITLLETTPDQPAAHIVGSTSVLVPTAFQWHLIVTDAEGNVLDETTAPPEMVHGRSVDRLETLECTFTQFAHHDFPDVGPVTIQLDGTVWAHKPR
jgi:hypothetical protein